MTRCFRPFEAAKLRDRCYTTRVLSGPKKLNNLPRWTGVTCGRSTLTTHAASPESTFPVPALTVSTNFLFTDEKNKASMGSAHRSDRIRMVC